MFNELFEIVHFQLIAIRFEVTISSIGLPESWNVSVEGTIWWYLQHTLSIVGIAYFKVLSNENEQGSKVVSIDRFSFKL